MPQKSVEKQHYLKNTEKPGCNFCRKRRKFGLYFTFDLGESLKLAVVSTAEGDDKPIKYPMLFREAKTIVLNKIDLIQYTNFNKSSYHTDLNNVNGKVPLFEVSCTQNLGMKKWYTWITNQIVSK